MTSKHMRRRIAARMREARERRGLTQIELAERLKVHKITISRWESGHRCPSIEYLEQVALALQYPISHFFQLQREPEQPDANGDIWVFECQFIDIPQAPLLVLQPFTELDLTQVLGDDPRQWQDIINEQGTSGPHMGIEITVKKMPQAEVFALEDWEL